MVRTAAGAGIGHNGGPSLNPALQPFWLTTHDDAGEPIRNRVLYGGRSSSKSWDAAGFAIFLAQSCRVRILCARQFQNKIEESVYSLLKIQIERFGLQSQFHVTDNKIVHKRTGSEFIFYGLWRHIDEIKSLEGIDILWIEEAHNLTEAQWTILEPTIRKEGSQIWVIFNPKLVSDFTYKRFVVNPPPGTIKRKINYTENPFLSSTMRRIIDAARAEDHDTYAHIYLGEPSEDDDASIIKRSWIMAAIDAHKALGLPASGSKRTGFDVADDGPDKCATIAAHGSLAYASDLWKAREDELLKSCTRVWTSALASGSSITYDSIGVGATAGAKFGELNRERREVVQYAKFNAGGAVFRPEAVYSQNVRNRDMFANIKAQAWWLVADRLRNTYNAVRNGASFDPADMIFISSDMANLDELVDELSTPKRDYDNAGKVKVESKKDLDKRDVASPNLADAFIMAFAPGVRPMVIDRGALGGI